MNQPWNVLNFCLKVLGKVSSFVYFSYDLGDANKDHSHPASLYLVSTLSRLIF